MKRMMKLAAALTVAAVSAFGGETVWVDRALGNDDSGDGSAGKPYASIQAAVEAAGDGDTVKVRPGVYDNGFRIDADGITNRVYVAGKKLKLVATGSRAETHIVGRHSVATAEGFGPDAIRCVAIRGDAALGTEVIGFTIRDGASNNHNPASDLLQDCAGGVLAADDAKKYAPTGAYVVDCEIRNCTGVRAGATRGVTAVRCFITRNYGSKSGAAGRNSAFVNCLITRNDGATFIYENDPKIYNCTVVNNRSRLLGSDVRNSIILNNNYNDGSKDTDNFINGASLSHSVTETTDYQFVAPLYDDCRLLEGCVAATAGDASELERLSLPGDIDPYVDYLGNAIPKTGTIAAGCIQTTVTPAGGAILFPEFNAICADGKPVYGRNLYAFAEQWPTQFQVQAAAKGVTPIRNFELNLKLVYPMMDDSLWILPPQDPSCVITSTVSKASRTLTVDPSAADATDERTDVDDSVPFKTISKALETAPHYTVIKVAPGEYGESEGTRGSYGPTRLVIEKQVRLLGAGADRTTIRGGEGIRCIEVRQSLAAIQGFTIADGQTDISNPNSDSSFNRGGGVSASSIDAKKLLTVHVLDCVITNCVAARGAGVYGTTCERTLISDCYGVKSNQRNARFVSCVFDYHGSQLDGQNGNGAYNGIHINCTLIGKDTSEYVFNSTSDSNPLTNSIVHTTREFKRTGACSGSIVWNAPTVTGDVALNADPCIANKRTRNYRLAAGSPALGLGDIMTDLDYCWTDFEGRPMNFTNGRPAAGAYQWPVRRVTVGTANGVVSDPSGVCGPEEDGTLEIVFGKVEGRHVSGIIVDGEKTDFAPGQTSVTLTFPEGDIAAPVSVQPFVEWFVNPNTDATGGKIVGDDANDGAHPTTPKRTLQGVFGTGYVLEGETVHAAEGVYDDGEDPTYRSRVTISPGASLVADAGPEKTFIVGRNEGGSTIAAHLSDNCLKCVWMRDDTRLVGFTLTGGGTDAGSDNQWNWSVSGGGVGGSSGTIVNCTISNNYSSTANCYNGTYIGCRIVGNFANQRNGAAYGAALFSCFVDRNEGNNAMQNMVGLYNCTVGASNTRNGSAHIALYNHGEPLVNCAFVGWVYGSDVMNAYNCKFLKGQLPGTYKTFENCEVYEDVSGFGLGSDYRPLASDGPLVDKCIGDYARTGANFEIDADNGQRHYNAAMDIGCYEYDWRPIYSAAIGVTVAEASPGVTSTGSAVMIPADGKVTVDWSNSLGRPTKSTFRVAVAEGSELTVTSNGEPLAVFGSGEKTFKYRCPAEGDLLEFACTGLGSAAIADFVRGSGMLLLVR